MSKTIVEIRAERDALLAVILSHREKGLSAQEIGDLLGKTEASIKMLCSRYNIAYTPKAESRKLEIASLVRRGKSNREIMQLLGVGMPVIVEARKRLGFYKIRCHPLESEMWSMKQQGKSGYRIAKDLGLPRMTVSDALRRIELSEARREPIS